MSITVIGLIRFESHLDKFTFLNKVKQYGLTRLKYIYFPRKMNPHGLPVEAKEKV